MQAEAFLIHSKSFKEDGEGSIIIISIEAWPSRTSPSQSRPWLHYSYRSTASNLDSWAVGNIILYLYGQGIRPLGSPVRMILCLPISTN